jgi:hypothetical protein
MAAEATPAEGRAKRKTIASRMWFGQIWVYVDKHRAKFGLGFKKRIVRSTICGMVPHNANALNRCGVIFVASAIHRSQDGTSRKILRLGNRAITGRTFLGTAPNRDDCLLTARGRKEGSVYRRGPIKEQPGPVLHTSIIVCYGYRHPFTISQPEYPVRHLPS